MNVARLIWWTQKGMKMSKRSSNWYEKRIKKMGYKGCRNCIHQIEPLRGCEYLERGGDGKLHIICPRWERKEE